jgi:hypothetical protein
MEPERSLPHSQQPAWARSIQSMPPPPPDYYLKIHFNIILKSKSGSSKWSLYLRFPHQTPVCTSHLPIYVTCLAHPIQSKQLLVKKFPGLSCYLSLVDPNILLSTLLSKTLCLYFSLSASDQVSQSYKTWKIIVLYQYNIYIYIYLQIKSFKFTALLTVSSDI